MAALIAVVATLVPALAEPPPYWRRIDCDGWHRPRVARRWLKAHVRSERPWLNERRVRRVRRCVPTHRAASRMARNVRRWRQWRMSYPHRWPIRFNRLPAGDRAWAVSTSSCESGMNPAAHNPTGIYHGAFQFLLSTWHAAGGTGDPHAHSWSYQAVIAVGLMHSGGSGHWPRCG